MGKYIILEDYGTILASMYSLLKREKPDMDYLLVKCNYNHNIPLEEVEKKEQENLMKYLQRECSKYHIKEPPREKTAVMMTQEDLLHSVSEGRYGIDDVFIMDITLFEEEDIPKDSFSDYASVKLAKKLVSDLRVNENNIRFYTRAVSESDPSAFLEQTGGCWRVPVLRPRNFDSPGNEEEVKEFINNVIN